MKTKNYLNLLAVTVAALSLNTPTVTAQYVDSVESLKNQAIAASPRAKEIFPWLTRVRAPHLKTSGTEVILKNELTEVKKNKALAASPRALEQFPELTRPAVPSMEFTIAPLVERNAAVLSSPRAQEEYPNLKRR